MDEHLRKGNNQRNWIHYLGKTIQNVLISLLTSVVREKILAMVHEAEYFAIILDCTPDVSRVEQLGLTV